jgi:hypothetical protein
MSVKYSVGNVISLYFAEGIPKKEISYPSTLSLPTPMEGKQLLLHISVFQ